MKKCDVCGDKIGVLQFAEEYEDEEGNTVLYCRTCHEKAEKENMKKEKLDMEKELKKVLQKNIQWEYKTISISISEKLTFANNDVDKDTDKRLNEMGEQGWELVSMSGLIAHNTLSGSAVTRKLLYVFKRKI